MRPRWVLAGVLLAALAVAAPASAHVEVLPAQATVNQAQEFTVRVPTEGDIATVGVRVTIPKAVTVYSFAAPPTGWTVHPIEAKDGTFAAVDYRGGSLGPNRYIEFRMRGTPRGTGTMLWPSVQRFANGTAKRWTGPPETPGAEAPETPPSVPGPSPAVQVYRQGAPELASATGAVTGDGGSSSAGIWLGVIAIVIAILAALGTGLLWSNRPARLPEDRPGE